ncbi:hypothetical protein [Streptomyces sp. NPDC053542]|uniref:hypothetical protein n=1 Tax=Streptomyces sp. NPDC053542 TaxID=3365710 RepID=UPI0037D6FD14
MAQMLRRFSDSRSAIAAAVIFGLIGALAGVLGVWDASTARTTPYRLLGVMFALSGGLLLLTSAVLARPQWRASLGRVCAILACGAGVFVGTSLCFLQLTLPMASETRRWWQFSLWLLIALASVVALLLARLPTATAERVPFGRLAKGLAAAGFTGVTLWGAVNWWYQNQYLPDSVAPALSVQAKMREVSPQKDQPSNMRIFRGEVTSKNVSETQVKVIASSYSVTREAVGKPPAASTSTESGSGEVFSQDCFWWQNNPLQTSSCGGSAYRMRLDDPQTVANVPNIARFSASSDGPVFAYGSVAPDGAWFEPGQKLVTNFLLRVPNTPYFDEDNLKLLVYIEVAKGARLALEASPRLQPTQIVPAAVSADEKADIEQLHKKEGALPHFYPYRYVVSAWGIQPLSTVQQMLAGPTQTVNTLRILQDRACLKGQGDGSTQAESDRNCSNKYWDNPSIISCIGSADDLPNPAENWTTVYRDPTRVCPLAGSPTREAVNAEVEKVSYYGMSIQWAQDVISLRPSSGKRPIPAGATDPAAYSLWDFPTSAKASCGPAMEKADSILKSGKKIEAALLEHKAIMDELQNGRIDSREATRRGMSSAKAGKGQFGTYDSGKADFDRAVARCRNDRDIATNGTAPAEGLASWQSFGRRVDAAQEAVSHATRIRYYLEDHINIMGRPGVSMEQSMLPLVEGGIEAERFEEALSKYQETAR